MWILVLPLAFACQRPGYTMRDYLPDRLWYGGLGKLETDEDPELLDLGRVSIRTRIDANDRVCVQFLDYFEVDFPGDNACLDIVDVCMGDTASTYAASHCLDSTRANLRVEEEPPYMVFALSLDITQHDWHAGEGPFVLGVGEIRTDDDQRYLLSVTSTPP